MATSCDNTLPGGTPTPGLLKLHDLVINKGHLTRRETVVVERIIADQHLLLQKELKDKPFQNAARHVIALMYYHTEKKKEAIQMLEKIVENDESNLNALQDLLTVYTEIHYHEKAEWYKKLLTQATLGGQGENNEKQLRYARCKAEQAYALLNDLPIRSWNSSEIRQKPVTAFEDALTIVEDMTQDQNDQHDQQEKRDWLFYTAQAYEKLSRTLLREKKIPEHVQSVVKTTSYLYKSMSLSRDNSGKSQIYCSFGNLFWKPLLEHEITKALRAEFPDKWEELQEIVKSAPTCYEKAIQLHKENEAMIFAKLGMYYKENQMPKDALQAFDKSIKAARQFPDDNLMQNACRIAYNGRALLYIAQSNKSREKNLKLDYLNRAKDDVEKSLSNHHPTAYATAGEVYYLLAHEEQDATQKKAFFQKALVHFKEAIECQDGECFANTHLKLARCLATMGDTQSAVGFYKITLDLIQTSPTVGLIRIVASELLENMFRLYQENGEPISSCRDIAYWLECTWNALRGDHEMMPKVIQRLYNNRYTQNLIKILEFVIHTATNSHTDMVRTCLKKLRANNHSLKITMKLNELDNLVNNMTDLHVTEETALSDQNIYLAPPREAKNIDVMYDFYVVSDEESRETDKWVQYSLLSNLECPYYGLKGYYQKRDSPLGELYVDAQEEAVTHSSFVLLVISRGFWENTGCRNVANMARHSNPQKLIVLQVESATIPSSLRDCRRFDFSSQAYIPDLARYMMPAPISI